MARHSRTSGAQWALAALAILAIAGSISHAQVPNVWGQKGAAPGQFDTPHALAFDSRGRLFVADRGNNCIHIFDQITASEGVVVDRLGTIAHRSRMERSSFGILEILRLSTRSAGPRSAPAHPQATPRRLHRASGPTRRAGLAGCPSP